jgi:hypothetical protein
VLLFSLLFFIGCSNGTTDTEPDTDTPPVGPSTPTDPVDPRVTRITILPGNVEVARNSSYTFTAQVEGIGSYDNTVTFSLEAPDTVGGEAPYMAGTTITLRGKLTVDLGEEVGRIIRVQAISASDPTVKGTVEATVAPTGPYFTWDPISVKVPVGSNTNTPIAIGYLRGYSRQDIDIRIRAGILEEGVDYTIAPENLVGKRGTIVVRGEDKHFDEVAIEIDASDIELIDPTKKGFIKINLEQAALFGADKDMVKANRLTLTLEVMDNRVIAALEDTEFDYDVGSKPIQGAKAPIELEGGYLLTSYDLVSISWDTLTYNGLFYKTRNASGAVVPVNATVKLRAAADKYFLGSISAADIANDTSFTDGPLDVKDITVSSNGKDLEFTLEYNVFALTLIKGVEDPKESVNILNHINATMGLKDFSFTAAGIPSHKDPLPAAEVLLNSYYDIEGTVDKVWSGAVEWADADKTSGAFKGIKGTPKARATATIALKPKIGYTFAGTDFVVGDLVGMGKIYSSTNVTNTVGSTLTSGPEGSLILTIVYEIDEKEIVLDDLVSTNFETLIARPIHGKPVGVGNPYAVSTAFTATADSPYTGTVSWDGAPYALQKFLINDDPTATVVLIPKPGYVFKTTATPYSDAELVSKAVAVDGPDATGGFAVATDAYKLSFTLEYVSGVDILQQITSLDGLSRTDINPVPDDPMLTETTIVGSTSPIAAGTSNNIVGIIGLNGGAFIRGTPATVTVTLSPIAGYTFYADDGPLPYLSYNVALATTDTEGARIKTLIEDHFSEVYKGTKVGTITGTKVTGRVESIEAPYLLASGDLVLTLKFPPKPEVIDETTFTALIMGDLAAEPDGGDPIPTTITGFDATAALFGMSAIEWTTTDESTPGEFVTGETYTGTITLTPKPNFTFIGAPVTTIEAALDDNGTGIWGNTLGTNIKLADTAITVTGVSVGPDEDLIPTDRDKLVITLTWVIP